MPFQSLDNREDGEEGGDEQEDGVGDEVAQGIVTVDYGWHDEGSLALKRRNMALGVTRELDVLESRYNVGGISKTWNSGWLRA